ncbi:hypothetical protein RQCS_61740 (plasmid) [Rhodococcus qingshengii]|uniref:alpha/beta fold hydrolase n=1 Tax=Rhodococcus qingshengii TaxID=334542 RepID=UPI0007E5AD3D|nr:alpha/beta hydrolase [Rhodococcus qingshengii]BCF86629.1 hypothetical protein RQCS_61740 [Rhodococcus qingshengii]
MPYASANDAEIYFTDSGGPGPALILSHGFLMDSSMFDKQREHLAQGNRILQYDARGHGATREYSTHTDFDYWDQAADLLAVLDAAGVDQASVGGMSQGGFIALRAALLAPSRVQSLILIATTACSSTTEENTGYKALFESWMSDLPLRPIAESLAPQLIGGTSHDQELWIERWMTSDRNRIRASAKCLMDRDSVVHRLGEINCPVTIIRGEDDQSFRRAHAELLHRALVNSTGIEDIPGAGHAVNWTHAEPVNVAIESFLRRTDQRLGNFTPR